MADILEGLEKCRVRVEGKMEAWFSRFLFQLSIGVYKNLLKTQEAYNNFPLKFWVLAVLH